MTTEVVAGQSNPYRRRRYHRRVRGCFHAVLPQPVLKLWSHVQAPDPRATAVCQSKMMSSTVMTSAAAGVRMTAARCSWPANMIVSYC